MKRLGVLITTITLIIVCIGVVCKFGSNGKQTVYIVAPLTGASANLGKIIKGTTEFYLNREAASFSVSFVDSESSASKALSNLNQALLNENDPIVISAQSFVSSTIIPYVETKKGFSLSLITIDSQQYNALKRFQHMGYSISDGIGLIADEIVSNKIEKVGVLYINDDFGIAYKDFLVSKIKDSVTNIKMFAMEPVEKALRNIVEKAISGNPDVIVVTGTPTLTFINAFVELKRYGYNGRIFADAAFSIPYVYNSLGKDAEGILFPCTATDVDVPEDRDARKFREDCIAAGLPPFWLTFETYETLKMIDKIIKEGAAFSQEVFEKMVMVDGVTGKFFFVGKGRIHYPMILGEVSDGKIYPKGK